MEDTFEVPDNFLAIINDFTNDLTTTFPEYSNLWSNITKTMNESSINTLYQHCMKVYP